MQIILNDAGRRYNAHWVFKHLTYTFKRGTCYALLGPNGSGKSTLLQVLTGSLHLSKGEIQFINTAGQPIPSGSLYREVSVAAPFTTLTDDMTLAGAVDFHFSFKDYKAGTDKQLFFEELGFPSRTHTLSLKHFSSGMRQRVKLLLALFSNTPLLALDEPTMNLDAQGISWYQQLVNTYVQEQLVLVASNDQAEYNFCTELINVVNLK